MATTGLLKIKVFWNKGHKVIIFIVDVTIRPKFGNFRKMLLEKPLFLRDGLGLSSIIWKKELKVKVRKFLGLTPPFVEVKEEKLVGGGAFCLLPSPFPILSRFKDKLGIFKSSQIFSPKIYLTWRYQVHTWQKIWSKRF